MTTYRLLVTPEGAGAQNQGQATIRIETAPVPRITEITITASAADGLSAATLPAIDLSGVIEALTAGVRTVAAPATTEPDPVAEAPAEPDPVPGAPAEPARVDTEPARAAAPARKAARARKSASVRKARKTDRPYRQMPDTAELTAVYENIGSVTGVATHYNVPRYTAQGWMSRLRKLGD